MKIILETDSKKRPQAQRNYNGVMGFRMTRGKYSDVVLLGIFKKIFKRLNLIDFQIITQNAVTFGTVNYFLNNQLSEAFAELFQNGFILFEKSQTGKIKYIHKSDAKQVNGFWTCNGSKLEVFYSDTFSIFGQSDANLIKDVLVGIDNSLNAARTVIKRLGVVVIGTPEQPSQNPQLIAMTETDKSSLETDMANDYGMLDEQKQMLLLRRPLRLTRVALGGKDLLITETVEMFTKILCDATNIPYDVMALSGQSTFANQEQAEKSMQDTAEEFISKTFKDVGIHIKMGRNLGINQDSTIQ